MTYDLAEVESLEKDRDYSSAAKKLRQFWVESPSDKNIAFKLASNLLKLGRVDESLPLFEICASNDDASPHWKLNFGHALSAAGSYDQAADQYRYLSKHVEHQISASAYWSLANLKRYQFSEEDKSDIETRLEESEINPGYIGLYRLALATALDQHGEYVRAFRNLELGNNIIGEIRPFRGDLFQKLINQLISSSHLPKETSLPHERRPIFVVGLPRSGSTLVEQILAAHSLVNSTDELLFISDVAKSLQSKGDYLKALNHLSTESAFKLGLQYLHRIEGYTKNAEPCFVDKTPENFLHIGLIKTILPNAKIVDVFRDPLDNAMSLYKQFFASGREYSYSLNGIIFYWQGYLTLMKHWKSIYPESIFRLNYEKLVSEPKKTISELLNFCELPQEDACFSPHKSLRPVLTPSAAQVRMPISSATLGSGLNYKDQVMAYLPRFAQLKSVSESLN